VSAKVAQKNCFTRNHITATTQGGTLDETSNNPLLARLAGFSLHAATVCEAYQRGRLERLCRYITRPPIATKRLTVDGRGRK
jgi:hypothetical protein